MCEKLWEPEKYNKFNKLQAHDAENMIKDMLLEGTQGVKTIVDIGCGSGNVTEMLANAIPTAKILAFDCSPGMIQYAKFQAVSKALNNQINYFVEDAGNAWENLNEQLSSLEGNVDVIFSNYALHWVPLHNRKNVVETIVRLLKPGGRLYIIFSGLLYYSPELIERMETLLMHPVPSIEEQRELWQQHFSQFASPESSFNVEWLKKAWKIDITSNNDTMAGDIRDLLPELLNTYKIYAKSDAVWEKNKEELLKLHSDFVEQAKQDGLKIVKGSFVARYPQIRITGFK